MWELFYTTLYVKALRNSFDMANACDRYFNREIKTSIQPHYKTTLKQTEQLHEHLMHLMISKLNTIHNTNQPSTN